VVAVVDMTDGLEVLDESGGVDVTSPAVGEMGRALPSRVREINVLEDDAPTLMPPATM
jgi:hypothetical protein